MWLLTVCLSLSGQSRYDAGLSLGMTADRMSLSLSPASPGMMLGRPMMMGGHMMPFAAPVPQLHAANGHRSGRRQPRPPPPPPPPPAEEAALFELMSTTDMIALLPPDVSCRE